MHPFIRYFRILILLLAAVNLTAQPMLSESEAVNRALENNFGIRLAQNAQSVSQNNTSKYNTGKLPVLSLSGGATYRWDNATANFQDGRKANLSFAGSYGANAAAAVDYVLFDGFFRKFNIEQLQQRYDLSALEVKAAMENVAANTLSQYYQVASLTESLGVLQETIDISQDRLQRVTTQFEYGQGSRLAILNAEVDLNNDSLNYINSALQLDNAKRLLNNLMVDMESLDYTVIAEVNFIDGLNKEQLKEDVINQNATLMQIDKNIQIGALDIDLANSRKLPAVNANFTYGLNYNNNNDASFLASSISNGPSLGLNFNWNIFDGGSTRVAVENAQLNLEGLQLQKEQTLVDLLYTFEDAWADYQNRLTVYRTEEKNVEINRENFERSIEQFNIGQITSVDFRQAQLNLLNAETRLIQSRFQVKIAEVEVLLLSGRILGE